MSAALDQPGRVRDEDAVDLARIDAFVDEHIAGLVGTPRIAQFPGGASNLAYLVSYDNRELVLRRAPAGSKSGSAHDMLREARVMAALKPHYRWVPTILATCADSAVIGHEFYVMERLRGSILRRELPPELGLDASGVRQLCLSFVDRLVALHRVDAALPALAHIGKGDGYIARQVHGWSERWHKALLEDTDACIDVLAWLAARQPLHDNASCVIHNDYRFDNVVLDPDDSLQIIGVLDWEMATIGDPLMDLGGSLAYWVQADDDAVFRSFRRQPTHVPGMLTRREMVHCYAQRSGMQVDNFDFYEVFGLFRLMVIIQQIYRRFALGQTSNPQFAGFGDAARYMGARCRRVIAGSKL